MQGRKVSKGAAATYTETVLGGPVVESERNVTTFGAPTELLIQNPDRVAFLIVNVGQIDVLMTMASFLPASAGIRITAGGGSFTCSVRDDFTLPSRGFSSNGIGGNSTLYVLELIRFTDMQEGN